jgi:hypothetical protein
VSRQRARDREAREATRRAEVEEAARRRAKAEARQERRARLTPTIPKRRRRYGALTTRELSQLVAVFFAVQAVALLFLESWKSRAGLAVLTLAVLLVAAATRRSTSR